MRYPALRRILASLAAAALIPACGGGKGGGGGGGGDFTTSISMTPGTPSGSSAAGTAYAGLAGSVSAFSRGNIHFGQVSPPEVPPLPAAPTTGTVVTTAMLAAPPADFGADGNLLITGAVTTPGTGSVNIIATDGDVVISGSLQSGGAATPDTIYIGAPAGTVYVSGSIRTSLGLGAGADGGALQIIARQIIITGSIDTRGDANDGGFAGSGGSLNFQTTGTGATSIYALGSINTTSGPATNTTAGSFAGEITVTANDEVWVGGSVIARGGDIHGTADGLTSGSSTDVVFHGSAGVFINSSIDLSGGNAFTTGTGIANGFQGSVSYGSFTVGNGGTLHINDGFSSSVANPSGPVYFFGSYTCNGGSASASAGTALKPICAGDCGSVIVGISSPNGAPASIEFGSAVFRLPGGNSPDTASGGGSVDIESPYAAGGGAPYLGDIVFAGSMDLSNGNGGNTTAVSGAGFVTLNAANGDVLLSGSITLGGGSASGDLSGAQAASISVTSGLNGSQGGIFSSASILANGPSSSAGQGGVGGTVQFQVQDNGSGITLLPGTVISANGGSGQGSGGGTGGTISLQTASNGNGSGRVSVSGVLTALGGSSGSAGGKGGRFFVDSCTSGGVVGGDVRLETGSLIDLSGGACAAGGGSAQNNSGGASVPTRTPVGSFLCCLEIWTHGSGTTPAEPLFPVASGGRLINNGLIRANGAPLNGSGGDMNIDAFQSDGSAAVTLGTLGSVSNAGSGTGASGIMTVH